MSAEDEAISARRESMGDLPVYGITTVGARARRGNDTGMQRQAAVTIGRFTFSHLPASYDILSPKGWRQGVGLGA